MLSCLDGIVHGKNSKKFLGQLEVSVHALSIDGCGCGTCFLGLTHDATRVFGLTHDAISAAGRNQPAYHPVPSCRMRHPLTDGYYSTLLMPTEPLLRSWTASTCLPSCPSSPSSTVCPARWSWKVRISGPARSWCLQACPAQACPALLCCNAGLGCAWQKYCAVAFGLLGASAGLARKYSCLMPLAGLHVPLHLSSSLATLSLATCCVCVQASRAA